MEVKEVIIKEMIIVTDGQSNVGGDPVLAAEEAFKKGIVVNTIGIVEQRKQDENSLVEIVEIAEAGGGLYEYTYIDDLYQTLQSVTYKTVNKTLQDTVNKQLKEIIGQDLEGMTPDSRSKFLQYIDKFSDEVALQCCILLDASGSMANKIFSARHSILDLMASFKGRKGKVDLAVIIYPGEGGENHRVIYNFGDDEGDLEGRLYDIKPRGTTPTAPAIYHGIHLMEDRNEILTLEDAII